MNILGMTETRSNLWKQAIKWPLYTVVIIPIFLMGSFNLYLFGNIPILKFILFNFAALLILLWENLTNDLFDSSTGVDKFKLHSVVNLIKNKKIISSIAYTSLLIGLLIIYFISNSKGLEGFLLVCGCCILGYLYQGPPFRLGYLGLGEPLCWLAFGPLANAAGLIILNPSQNYGKIPWKESILLGSGPSLAITLVLFCSHFHQIKEDKKFGKISPLVRIGAKKGAFIIPWIILLIYSFQFFILLIGFLPHICILYLISLPSAISLTNLLKTSYQRPEILKNCKFIAIKFQTLNGIGLIIGLIYSYLSNK